MKALGKKRLLGLRALVEDLVEHGSSAVERVHRATVDRTFTVLEAVPPIAEPAKLVHAVHGMALTGVYGAIRGVNRVVGAGLEMAIEMAVKTDDAEASIVERGAVGGDEGAGDGPAGEGGGELE